MIRGSSVAESGETGARSGWFVELSGMSALNHNSLVAHSGHWREICTLMIRGSVGQSRGGVGGGVGAVRSKFQRSHYWRVLGTFRADS